MYPTIKNFIEYTHAKYYRIISPALTLMLTQPLILDYFKDHLTKNNSLDISLYEMMVHVGTPILIGGFAYIYGKTLNQDLIDNITKLPNRESLERNKRKINQMDNYSIITCSLQKVKDERERKYKYPRKVDLEQTTQELIREFSCTDSRIYSNSVIQKFYIVTINPNEDDLNIKCKQIRKNLLERKIDLIHGMYTRKFDDENFDKVKEESQKMHDIHAFLHSESGNLFETLDFALKQRDPYTSEHSHRVTNYAILLGIKAGLSYNDILKLEVMGTLHDIGKIGVPDHILNKHDSLTLAEFEKIQKHPQIGFDLIIHGREELIDEFYPILYHHERWDGQGYPQGISKENIPLLSRILSIADTYSAITEERPYKSAKDPETAFKFIQDASNTQFDPSLVKQFIEIKDSIIKYTLNPELKLTHKDFHDSNLLFG